MLLENSNALEDNPVLSNGEIEAEIKLETDSLDIENVIDLGGEIEADISTDIKNISIENIIDLGSNMELSDQLDITNQITVSWSGDGGGGASTPVDNEFLKINSYNQMTINPLYRSGYLVVDNVVKRNLLNRNELEVGTRCYVKNDDKFYRLTISTGDSKVWEDDSQVETFDRYASSEKYGTVIIGDNLTTDQNGKLVVDVATREEQGSSKPITAGAVYDILGDIKIKLENI